MITLTPVDTTISLDHLSQAKMDGLGSFDVLMRAFKTHLDEEYAKNRIRGPEYSQVYLGGMQAVLSTGLQFTLSQQKTNLENSLLEQQIELAKVQKLQTIAQTELVVQQKANLVDELQTNVLQRQKLTQEIANLVAQKALLEQQKTNLADELLTNIEQRKKLVQEVTNLSAQLPLITAQVQQAQKQGTLIDKQIEKLAAEILSEAATRDRIAAEVTLLAQKKITEQAQTTDSIAGANSVLGKQITLYGNQANGFLRDAEQKAAQIMATTWQVRRTTDDATVADGTNKLDDAHIGAAIQQLLTGAGIP